MKIICWKTKYKDTIELIIYFDNEKKIFTFNFLLRQCCLFFFSITNTKDKQINEMIDFIWQASEKKNCLARGCFFIFCLILISKNFYYSDDVYFENAFSCYDVCSGT